MKVKVESEKVGLKLNIHSKQCFIYIANVSMYYIFFTIKVQKIFKKKKKLNIQKTKVMTSGPITSQQIDGETVETVTDFIFLG